MTANFHEPIRGEFALTHYWVFQTLDDGEYIILSGVLEPSREALEEATGLEPFPEYRIAYGPVSKLEAFEFYQDVAGSETVKWNDEDEGAHA